MHWRNPEQSPWRKPMSRRDEEITRFKEMVDREVEAYALVWQKMGCECTEACPLLPALRQLSSMRYNTLAKKAASLGLNVAELKHMLPPSE
jgi:hypothetical protein